MSVVSNFRGRLASQHESLDRILGDRSAEAMSRRPAPGKWTAHEQLAHIARHHQLTLERLGRVLTEESPRFPRYRADEDPEWARFRELSAGELLSSIAQSRAEIDDLIGSLSEDQLARVGTHPAFGVMTVLDVLDFFLLHEAHHLYVTMGLFAK